jgi:hypothetical protein
MTSTLLEVRARASNAAPVDVGVLDDVQELITHEWRLLKLDQ